MDFVFKTGSNSVVGLTRRRISITEDGAVCKNKRSIKISLIKNA